MWLHVLLQNSWKSDKYDGNKEITHESTLLKKPGLGSRKGWDTGTSLTEGFHEKQAVTSGNFLFSSTGILINCSWQIAPSSVVLHLHEKGSLGQELDCPVPPAGTLEAFCPLLFCFVTLGLNIYSTICAREIGWSYLAASWWDRLGT